MKHISVLLDECINGLDIKENGIYVSEQEMRDFFQSFR